MVVKMSYGVPAGVATGGGAPPLIGWTSYVVTSPVGVTTTGQPFALAPWPFGASMKTAFLLALAKKPCAPMLSRIAWPTRTAVWLLLSSHSTGSARSSVPLTVMLAMVPLKPGKKSPVSRNSVAAVLSPALPASEPPLKRGMKPTLRIRLPVAVWSTVTLL